MANYDSVPIHEHAEFMESCAEVLREEWARSKASRLFMLEKSNDSLPYSIGLLKRASDSDSSELIGHSRICKIFREPHAGFVESVVIRKDHRGLGLGRKLMEETEKHAKKLGLTVLYLTTHDKQGFYQHIGYQFCAPIVSIGSASGLLSEEQLSKLLGGLGMHTVVQTEHVLPSTDNTRCLGEVTGVINSSPTWSDQSSPPPPPPLLLPSAPTPPVTKMTCSWMKKQLSN